MTPEALLDRLVGLGLTISPSRNPGMVVVNPIERLTPDLRDEVLAHKAELLELLEARQPPSRAWADQVPPPVERPPSDPRPELVADSLAWAHLLAFASTDRANPRGLFAVLHGARCGGALLRFDRSRWRLEPRIDPDERVSSWHDEAAWEADRGRYLLPHRQRLTALLRLLPAPSRLGAPPLEVEAGVAALRALGWTFKLKAEGGLTATCPGGLSDPDVAWCRTHVDQIVALIQGERE
jgi:hypothetical protein